MTRDVTALLLAGNRPGGDPLAAAFGVASKALVPLAGAPMLARVARALVDHPRIARVIVLSQPGIPLAEGEETRWLAADPRIRVRAWRRLGEPPPSPKRSSATVTPIPSCSPPPTMRC